MKLIFSWLAIVGLNGVFLLFNAVHANYSLCVINALGVLISLVGLRRALKVRA